MLQRARPAAVALLAAAALGAAAPRAHASYIVARDAKKPVLTVNSAGRAVVSFSDRAGQHRVLVYDAVNALPPTSGKPQVAFKVRYSGARTPLKSACSEAKFKAANLRLPWLVAGCRMPDGSFWALQTFARLLPDFGFAPWLPIQRQVELHISHWTGALPKLKVVQDWAYGGRFQHFFGRLTYLGKPVYGLSATAAGSPLDPYDRSFVLDTLDSAYGPGWRRDNSFLAHRPTGAFCYVLGPHNPPKGFPQQPRPSGAGKAYRITVEGPGVTPIIQWQGTALGAYDRDLDKKQHAAEAALGDPNCKPH